MNSEFKDPIMSFNPGHFYASIIQGTERKGGTCEYVKDKLILMGCSAHTVFIGSSGPPPYQLLPAYFSSAHIFSPSLYQPQDHLI